ncbi:hypothetical protein BS47DRAFT_1370080 [Hydnum rufescens UP504]|uniref:Uncharacterized protein n=1 Tax=Hydnum rufescens UP504 TaxID=1448309 RepID=A0A9P6DL33_9AGAM|nr:hypothetical protein BS47DRAFT_1370080 [Hydnum rufescens UP504]
MIGSPQGVIEGLFLSLGQAHEVCGDILWASYEYGGLAHYFMHRYIDHIASEDPLTEVPHLGFDDDMVGTVFRYPLPCNLVAIQTILSWLESHGVPIFGVEELQDHPSNYSDIPPPPTPPWFLSSAMLVLWAMSDDDDEVSTGDELEALWKQMQNDEKGVRRKGVIRQKMDESDEAFEARKVEAEGKSAAEKDAAAKYIQKARGGILMFSMTSETD